MYRSLARRIARSSVGDLESHQGIDRRDSECSVESSSSASSGSNSKRKRPVRAFPTDSNDVDPWVLHHVLDEELGIGNWELQQHLDRSILFASRDLTQEGLARLRDTTAQWFMRLRELNEVLAPQRDKIPTSRENATKNEWSAIKIAIISSGIWPNRHVFKQWNFIKNGDLAKDDDTGRGTNSVDLVLQVFDRAELFVAKVFEGSEADEDAPKRIRRAIRWARRDQVDIICIPASVNTSNVKFESEDETNVDQNPLIFAAAAGGISTDSVTYPAKMEEVFPIFSTDGQLRISEYNPLPIPGQMNFAILGEHVTVDSSQNPISGTSVSTSIATGVAARLLDFARQPDSRTIIDEESFKKMRTKKGMTAIFKLMSYRSDNGYNCLAPWELLPPDHATQDRRSTRKEICQSILSALQDDN